MKIIFTSCMDAMQMPVQPIWEKIGSENPDVLLLLGDQIYMDWGISRNKREQCMRLVRDGLKGKQEGLQTYAEDMHNRYAMQWAEPEFRALMRRLREANKKILVCWDDHDFAWNNANGLGDDSDDKDAVVPWQVKHVSKTLFNQFKDRIQNSFAHDEYPDFELQFPIDKGIEKDTSASQGIQEIGVDLGSKIQLALLDERWYRYPRSQRSSDSHPLLGEAQWMELESFLKSNADLKIVAGGLPMKHNYFASHQAWGPSDQGNETAYPEYDMFLAAANTPTLYLAGDIHKNEFAGFLHNSNGVKNKSLLHICASPAAVPNVFFVKFEPAYGCIEIDEPHRSVSITENMLGNAGWIASTKPPLSYSTGKWEDGHAVYQIPSDLDLAQHGKPYLTDLNTTEPDLSVVCRRARTKASRSHGNELRFSQIDTLFEDNLLNEFENNGSASQTAGSGRSYALNIRANTSAIDFVANDPADERKTGVVQVVDAAFERALSSESKTVVLFVHGYNNSFEDSVDSAYALRSIYGVEPVLLSWPSGYAASFWDAGYDAKKAYDNSQYIQAALIEILQRFAFLADDERFKNLKQVVLARSYGAQAIQSLFDSKTNANFKDAAIKHFLKIDALVLSQPAIPKEKLEKWITAIPSTPIYVTINKNDFALKWGYRGIHKIWDPLGRHVPNETEPVYGNMHYFDCSQMPGISTQHNFITTTPSADIASLHQALLQATFHPVNAPPGFRKLPGSHNIWTKF
jgi:Alpha/beta hydrolase of unknown function (DUF900)/PhoD-like phosphatase